jgi:cell division initiation protein
MLTPQEVASKEFVKAVFGGYDMAAVDDFLETLTNDFTALFKENAILKSKIKVLVEKVEEYRSTDEAMRMALLTAQRLGDEITSEAKKKSEELLAQTEAEVRIRLSEMKSKFAEEEERLRRAKEETRRFVQASQEILRQHAAFLERLEGVGKEPEGDKPAEEVEETAPEAQQPEPEPEATPEEPVSSDDPFGMHSAPEKDDPFDRIFRDEETVRLIRNRINGGEEEDLDATKPRFDFGDLKFGKNYSGD